MEEMKTKVIGAEIMVPVESIIRTLAFILHEEGATEG